MSLHGQELASSIAELAKSEHEPHATDLLHLVKNALFRIYQLRRNTSKNLLTGEICVGALSPASPSHVGRPYVR